jgi:hypothetical protein
MKPYLVFYLLGISISLFGQSNTEYCYFIPYDTIFNIKAKEIKKIKNLLEIEGIHVNDTLKGANGLIFSIGFDTFIAYKRKSIWEYWQLENEGSYCKYYLKDFNHKGAKELFLFFESSDGRYNYSGGFSSIDSSLIILDLETKQTILNIPIFHHQETSNAFYLTDEDPNSMTNEQRETQYLYTENEYEDYSASLKVSNIGIDIEIKCWSSGEDFAGITQGDTNRINFNYRLKASGLIKIK